MTQPGRPESPWDLYPEQEDDVSSTAWMTPDHQETPAPRPAPVTPVAPPPPLAGASAAPGALWAARTPSPLPEEAASVTAIEGYVPAGTAPRVIAWIIDCMIVAVLGAVATIPFAAVGAADNPGGVLLMGLVNMGVSHQYFTRLWLSDRRATFGMRVMGLGVGRAADAAPLTYGDATVRWLAFGGPIGGMNGVPGLAVFAGLGILIWYPALAYFTERDARHRGPHDHAAGSLVVARPGSRTLGR